MLIPFTTAKKEEFLKGHRMVLKAAAAKIPSSTPVVSKWGVVMPQPEGPNPLRSGTTHLTLKWVVIAT